jgi:hypothetical protein
MELINKEPEKYYCSECGTEVNLRDKKCPNCKADLDEIFEEEIESPIEIKRFNNELEAELLADNLKAHGIFAFIKRGDPATMGLFREAKVFVSIWDKKKSLELIKALKI